MQHHSHALKNNRNVHPPEYFGFTVSYIIKKKQYKIIDNIVTPAVCETRFAIRTFQIFGHHFRH